MVKERDYGLDIVRIISMLGIVILHINGAGGVLGSCQNVQAKYLASNWVEICAYTSVDLFGLLSGYLGLYKKRKSCYRTLELIFIVAFYCVVITALFLIFLPDKIVGIKAVASGLVPQLKGRYWYITCYIPVAIFQPYINKMILSLNEKEHLRLSVLIIALFGFIQSFVIVDLFTFKSGYSFVWLLCLYIIGAYIRRVDLFSKAKKLKVKTMAIFLAGSAVLLLGNLLIKVVMHRTMQYFVSYISPITLLMSICLLLFFRGMQINHFKKTLSFLSMVTFDVYLIHCHILIYDNYITDGFKWITSYSVLLIPVLIVLSALAIFFVTSIIGGMRSFLFRAVKLDKMLIKISAKADNLLYCKE